MANPLLVRPDEDVFGGLLAGMTPKEAGGLAKSGVEYAGSLLDNIASTASRVAEKAPGSLGRAWQSSDFRRKAQEAIDTASYYAGPHLSDRAAAIPAAAAAATENLFGNKDAREASAAFREGKVGQGAKLLGLGSASALLDVPTLGTGSGAVRGLLRGLTKAAHYTPDLSMFAGPMAATADKAALSTAQKMAEAGAERKAIWDKTGWFKGADDKWRFEIPDNMSSYDFRLPAQHGHASGTVGEFLKHQPLADAYPSLMQTPYEARKVEASRGGAYSPGEGGNIMVRAPDAGNAKSVTLHELQHGVQDIEGFAKGGSPYGLSKGTPAWDIYQERLKAIASPLPFEQFAKQAGYEDMAAAARDYKDYVKQAKNPSPMIDRAAQEYATQEAYRRQAGEVEARNVQTRRNMTPEELRATPPWETQDVPDLMQLLRFR